MSGKMRELAGTATLIASKAVAIVLLLDGAQGLRDYPARSAGQLPLQARARHINALSIRTCLKRAGKMMRVSWISEKAGVRVWWSVRQS